MKKLIYGTLLFATVGIGLFSCEKEEVVGINSTAHEVLDQKNDDSKIGEDYNFSKSLTIRDRIGNEVDLVVFANTKENVENLNGTSFEIALNNAEDIENNIISNSIQAEVSEEDLKNITKNSVLVYIKDRRFSTNVTSFAVYPTTPRNQGRASSGNYKNYAYASDNVIGASATYTSETRSKEYMELDIKKKNGPNGIWSRLLGTKLYNVGNSSTYCGSTIYHTMMIKVNFHRIRTGTCCYGYSYSFKTSC